ncbi:hypothetical protein [uncultured Pseudacidovorax sp.]|uniref:hypothetical protein n=1 Tax=uncultured Pseudacidovorax sp. TaxID=679313 RepID=UPI0025E9F3A8|nr:hypothetical protein [uncultured Pseudacidovorax sp.]
MADESKKGEESELPEEKWMNVEETRAFLGDMPYSTFWDLRQDETAQFPEPAKPRGRPLWSRRQVHKWLLTFQQTS